MNRARFTGGTYTVANAEPLRGRDFVDAFFGTWADAYLADPNRTWDSMASDEIHCFMQRLVRVYGWTPFKATYRTYAQLDKAAHQKRGPEKPTAPEEKIRLLCAVLSQHTGADLVPAFRMWRFPVTSENVAAVREKYLTPAR